MSLYRYFVAPDPLYIDPFSGKVGKYNIYEIEPNPIYPTIAVFVSWADAFNFINPDMYCATPSWDSIKSKTNLK